MTVYVPHLSLLWDLIYPHPIDDWLSYDLAILVRCDALYRKPGTSLGSEKEIRFANAHNIPVFREKNDLLAFAIQYLRREI